MHNSAIKSKLGLIPRIDEEDCRHQAQAAIKDRLGDPGVVDDVSLMTCVVAYIPDDCHDEVCEQLSTREPRHRYRDVSFSC